MTFHLQNLSYHNTNHIIALAHLFILICFSFLFLSARTHRLLRMNNYTAFYVIIILLFILMTELFVQCL